jgi:hypothetical protein
MTYRMVSALAAVARRASQALAAGACQQVVGLAGAPRGWGWGWGGGALPSAPGCGASWHMLLPWRACPVHRQIRRRRWLSPVGLSLQSLSAPLEEGEG